jgi:thiol-disulfide isomerase/thioredoxin
MRRAFLLAAAAVFVVAVSASGSGLGPPGTSVSAPGGEPRISGVALPDAPFSGDDPGVGLPAPRVTGGDVDGSVVVVGEPHQVVVFMASWCPACQAELPEVVAFVAAGAVPDGVELVIVATLSGADGGEREDVQWLFESGWRGRTLLDGPNSSALSVFGIPAVPGWVLIDGEGRVAGRRLGQITEGQLAELFAAVAPPPAG